MRFPPSVNLKLVLDPVFHLYLGGNINVFGKFPVLIVNLRKESVAVEVFEDPRDVKSLRLAVSQSCLVDGGSSNYLGTISTIN